MRTLVTEQKLIDEAVREKSTKRLPLKKGKYKDVEEILVLWFCEARACSTPIDGEVLKEKALKIAEDLNALDFKASNGWLDSKHIMESHFIR